VAGLTEVEAANGDEIMKLLHKGNERRTQQPTAANEVSSRSHAVLSVVVESKERAPGTVAKIKVGKLSLIDLAGSERAANTQNRGVRLVEGANINRSLLALGNCINALGEKGNKGNFVPYRDSKLTRLLKDSLGGNCRTVMIANISSAESSFEETLNTLKYANRAKNIKTNVQRNELNVDHHISEYVSLIANLRNEIKFLKGQIVEERQQFAPMPQQGELLSMPAIQNIQISTSEDKASDAGPGRKAGRDPHASSPGAQVSSVPFAAPKSPGIALRNPSTPFDALRQSMRSASAAAGEGRELMNMLREKIVENFQERMQLRRSLIELEDVNVQNSIEISKRQLMVVHWAQDQQPSLRADKDGHINMDELIELISTAASEEVREAWEECEQLRKAVAKNQVMKKNIAKRLRNNEKEVEAFRAEIAEKVTGDDRRELMELQYQVGKLELENMELEQQKMVHDSILKGKDLMIHKLKLQLAMKDKLIQKQRALLAQHGLDVDVGYSQMLMVEDHFLNENSNSNRISNAEGLYATLQGPPPSPPRQLGPNSNIGTYLLSIGARDDTNETAAVMLQDSLRSNQAAPQSKKPKALATNRPASSGAISSSDLELGSEVPKLSKMPAGNQAAVDNDADYVAQISDVRDKSHLSMLHDSSIDEIPSRTKNWQEAASDAEEVDDEEEEEDLHDDGSDASVDSEITIEMRRREGAGVPSGDISVTGQGAISKGGRIYRKSADTNLKQGPRKHHPPSQKKSSSSGLKVAAPSVGPSPISLLGGKAGGPKATAESKDSMLPLNGNALPIHHGGIRGGPASVAMNDVQSKGIHLSAQPASLRPVVGRANSVISNVGGGVPQSKVMRHSPIAVYGGGDQGGLYPEARGVGRSNPAALAVDQALDNMYLDASFEDVAPGKESSSERNHAGGKEDEVSSKLGRGLNAKPKAPSSRALKRDDSSADAAAPQLQIGSHAIQRGAPSALVSNSGIGTGIAPSVKSKPRAMPSQRAGAPRLAPSTNNEDNDDSSVASAGHVYPTRAAVRNARN
jgi:kinesin family protein 18/19